MKLREQEKEERELERWDRFQEREHQIKLKQKQDDIHRQAIQQPTNHDLYKKPKQSSSQVVDTLDWMLAHNIITPQEYTQLMGKCLPFIQ